MAIKCFKDFLSAGKVYIPGARPKLYFVRPEPVFVKFGDQEAEAFYAEQERKKKEYELDANLKKSRSYEPKDQKGAGNFHRGGGG